MRIELKRKEIFQVENKIRKTKRFTNIGHCTEELMFWTVVLEKTLESPLDCMEIQPVHPKGNQSWVFIGRTDVEAETPIFLHQYSWCKELTHLKIPDVRKDWRQEEKGTIEDEMAGWYHQLDGHEFELAPGVGDRQRSLACYSPWGHRVQHNWLTELNFDYLTDWRVVYYIC